jgi:UPF0042 nucleotide-binding protein
MLTFISFSYKKGVPEEADAVFDCRSIQNPHHVPELKPLTGRSREVQDFVSKSAAADEVMSKAADAILKNAKTLAFGCYGGRHRSVAVAELMAKHANVYGYAVTIKHRELD